MGRDVRGRAARWRPSPGQRGSTPRVLTVAIALKPSPRSWARRHGQPDGDLRIAALAAPAQPPRAPETPLRPTPAPREPAPRSGRVRWVPTHPGPRTLRGAGGGAPREDRALERSAHRSSTFSIPTDSRSRSAGTDVASVEYRRRRSRLDSTPPRLVAGTQSCSASTTASAAATPPCGRRPMMEPYPVISRVARSCPGSVGRLGWRTSATRGCAASRRASSAAVRCERSTRSARVRSPRSASQTSHGPAIDPCSVR